MATSIPVVLLESEPATEWLCGGPVRKVSPKRTHAVLQGALVSYASPDLFEHAALPGFSIDLARFFAEVRRR